MNDKVLLRGARSADPLNPELTVGQARFVEEYIPAGGDPRRAALAAGYSPDSVEGIAPRILARPAVQEALKVKRQEIAERAGLSADMVIAELMAVGFANIVDFMRWSNDEVVLRSAEEILASDDAWKLKAVQEVSLTNGKNGTTVKVKLHDKLAALDKLAKILDLFAPEKVEVSGTNGGPIEFRDRTNALVSRLARIAESRGAAVYNPGTDSGGAVLPGAQLEVLGEGRTTTP